MRDRTIKFLRTSQGDLIWLDPEDYEWAKHQTWHRTSQGYFRSSRGAYLHCLICPSEGQETDHWNGQRNDCRRGNLRPCTRQQNAFNAQVRKGPKSSRYKGVSRVKKTGRWAAHYRQHGIKVHLGYFDSEDAAARAYDRAVLFAFGAFARPNFNQEEQH